MPDAIFRSTVLKHFHVVLKEGGPICRAKFAATYSDKLRDDMDWEQLPATANKMDLDAELIGGKNFILTPNGNLKQHEIDVPAVSAQKFQIVRVKSDDGDSTTDEIRFEILTNDPESVVKLWQYMGTVGDHPAVLKLRYSEQATIDEPSQKGEEESPQRSIIGFDRNPKSPLAKKNDQPDEDNNEDIVRPGSAAAAARVTH